MMLFGDDLTPIAGAQAVLLNESGLTAAYCTVHRIEKEFYLTPGGGGAYCPQCCAERMARRQDKIERLKKGV
jgi:hypothetical protein